MQSTIFLCFLFFVSRWVESVVCLARSRNVHPRNSSCQKRSEIWWIQCYCAYGSVDMSVAAMREHHLVHICSDLALRGMSEGTTVQWTNVIDRIHRIRTLMTRIITTWVIRRHLITTPRCWYVWTNCCRFCWELKIVCLLAFLAKYETTSVWYPFDSFETYPTQWARAFTQGTPLFYYKKNAISCSLLIRFRDQLDSYRQDLMECYGNFNSSDH